MSFKLQRHHLSRSKHVLRAWGEYKRVAWAAANGLKTNSLWRTGGDLAHYELQQVERANDVMEEIKRTDPDKYHICYTFYVDQKAVTSSSDKRLVERNRYAMTCVHKKLFERMWPEALSNEIKFFNSTHLKTSKSEGTNT